MTTPPVVPPGAMPTGKDDLVMEPVDGYRAQPNAMPSVMLQGEMGAGKSKAIESLCNIFDEVFVLALEPGIADVLGHIPPKKLHWHYVAPSKSSMKDLMVAFAKFNKMSNDDMQKVGHINREKFQEFIEVMKACDNFKCDRTGEEFGSVETWGTTRAFVLDGLSGLNIIVQHFTIGLKPFLELRDYLPIQNQIHEFLTTLTNDSKCFFLMTAHLERETDDNSGASQLMVSTIGRKLAPKLGRFFSDVILTERISDGNTSKWRWVTQTSQVKCKTRNLPWSKELVPTFELLMKNWHAKQAAGAK